jgi:hypothetical protein
VKKPKSYKRGTTLTTEEKIAYIEGLMYSGVWRRGRTVRLLAKEWGLAVSTVQQLSAEASRTVRRQISEPDAAAVDVTLALREVMEDALEDAADSAFRMTKEGLKARDQVIASAKAYSDIMGCSAPIKIEVDAKKATPEAARALMRQKAGDVTPGEE